MQSVVLIDNLKLMQNFVEFKMEGFIDLIYIDPPFNSNRDYKDKNGKVQFTDRWLNTDMKEEIEELKKVLPKLEEIISVISPDITYYNYLVSMGIRLYYMRRLLKDTGSIYVHCDDAIGHYLKVVLDYIFGIENFRNHISWKRTVGNKSSTKRFGRNVDFIFFYTKTDTYNYIQQYNGLTDEEKAKKFKYSDEKGNYCLQDLASPSKGLNYDYKGYKTPPKGYRCTLETIIEWDNEGLIHFPDSKTKQLKKKNYELTNKGVKVDNNWEYFSSKSDYPTQKPEALLERIIKASSNEGDLVMDFYNGGGTTGAVCKKLNRNYLGCDISKDSVEMSLKRLESIKIGSSIVK